ncbi:unnamed protein product [Brachionus calyciflorus]|uniref:Basement membrane-specific heparan sulfate proteoglycan core protein n=1 Tax=Brachionus calyciflorus TaxID=104777 RepID=A0A813QJR7_9BILA|nr:unnamed protein product [Brachionus calyciflorus]
MRLLNIRNILLLGFILSFTNIVKTQTDYDGNVEATDGSPDAELFNEETTDLNEHGTSDGAAEVAEELKQENSNADENTEMASVDDEHNSSLNSTQHEKDLINTDDQSLNSEATSEEVTNQESEIATTELSANENISVENSDLTSEIPDENSVPTNGATIGASEQSTDGASHEEATELTSEGASEGTSELVAADDSSNTDAQTVETESSTEADATETQDAQTEYENQVEQSSTPDAVENSVQTTTIQSIELDSEMTTSNDDESSGETSDLLEPSKFVICGEDQIKCDMKCLSIQQRCDKNLDCLDGSDEENCDQETTLTTEEETTTTEEETTATEEETITTTEEIITSTNPIVETTEFVPEFLTTTTSIPGVLEMTLNPDVETLKVRQGGVLQFNCDVTGPYSKLLVLVYKDTKPVDQSDSGSLTVRIENFKASDAGSYLCYGFPEDRSNYVVKSLNVELDSVIVGFPVYTESPNQNDNVKYVEFPVDSNIEIECEYSSEENLKWRRVDNVITDYNREFNGKLLLYYLRIEDSGLYECELPDGRRSQVRLRVTSQDNQPQQTTTQVVPTTRPDYDEQIYAIRAYVRDQTIEYKSGDNVEQECDAMTNGNSLEIKWFDPRKQEIKSTSQRFSISTTETSQSPLGKISKLVINGANPADSGYYECVVVVGSQKETVQFELKTQATEIGPQKVCDIEEATCRNGQCIPRSGLCDGRTDCSDGSDELNCGGSNDGRCEPNEKQCRNQKCIQKIWFCDGENDCGDNSDEDQCPQPKPGEICKTHEFLCRNGQQCVLKGFVCDGEYDCLDQSDEIGCEKPSIVRGPVRNLTVVLGRSFTIRCEATGFPAPYINWRLNWGHVCEEPRCVTTNENGVGTLTVNNALITDAGAYSCEALNSKGRIFAIPDAIVYVQINNNGNNIEPTRPNLPVTPPPITQYCDQYGSYNRYPPCQCRPYITGTFCDQCQYQQFHLVIENRNSLCAQCFCNGLNVNCRSSNLFYDRIESSLVRDNEDWSINNLDRSLRTPLITRDRSLEFRSFEDYPSEDFYFYAPARYLGNKLGSYGGNFTFNIRFEGPSARPKKLDIRLSGNGVNLIYRLGRMMYPYQDYKINILMVEDDFKRFEDNGRIDREQFLTVLADLDKLMIRARYLDYQYAVILNQISLDHAERAYSQTGKKALAVETCDCPIGYTGKSCESCAQGYKRVQTGSYLGRCEKAQDVQITLVDVAPNNVLTLTPGENHVVYVTVIGSGDYVQWVKEPEGYLPTGVSQQYNNLVISNARPEMSGNYTCYIITPNGEIRKVLVINIPGKVVRQPPRIYSPTPRVQSLSVGEPFELECSAIGDPRPTVRIETPPSRFAMQPLLRGEASSAKFQVNYFTEDNAGTYYCIADNGIQVVEKFEVSLKTGYPPFIQIYPKEIEAYEGSSLTINYTITGTQPVNVKVKLYSSTSQDEPLGSIYVDKDTNNIMIRQITRDMDGQYLIEASNDYGTIQDYFSLRVLETPGPRISIAETVVRTLAGSNIKIEPQVQFSGRPYFTWTKDGSSLPSDVLADRQTLYIPKTSKNHQGTYTLTLIDDYGTAKIQVNLIVDEPLSPIKTFNPSRIIVKHDMDIELEAGKNANLLCQIHQRNSNSRVISTTSWIRGNKAQRERFPSNIRPNQERLQIIKVKPTDAGQYTCIVSSSDGTTQIAVVNLRVRAPEGEQIESVPPSARLNTREKTASQGDSFELTCTVSGYPTPTIQWLFNNDRVDRLQNVYVRDNTLHVRDAQVDLNGYFTCRAVGQEGRYAEDSATIRVLEREPEVPKQFSVDVNPRSSNPSTGETVKLLCVVFDYDGNTYTSNDLKFTWSRQDGDLPSGAYASSDSLTLYNLQAQDSGSYVCQVENVVNGLQNSGYSLVNVIQDFPSVPENQPVEPLRVEVSPKELNLKQGREGELFCSVTGGRNPSLKWKKSGEELDPSRHLVEGGKLRILNAVQSDRGYFECEVIDGDDYARDYALVEIEASELPQIEIFPNLDQLDLDYGATAYIQCRIISGTPTPSLEWRRVDGQQFSQGASSIQDGSLLQIVNAGQNEFGVYECVARNEEGEARGRISLVPRGNPTVVEQQPEQPEVEPERPNDFNQQAPDVVLNQKRVEIREGETASLKCGTTSPHQVRFAWYAPDGSYIGGDEEGNVQIENIQKSGSGYYTCQIVSSYGETSDRVFVDILENEPAQLRVEVRPKSKTASEGGRAEFTCHAKDENGNEFDDTLIKWSRPGSSQLPQNHQVRGNQLILYNVNENDGGRYLCTVQATYGRIGFDAAYLQISKRDSTSAFPVYIRVLESPTDTYQPTAAFRYGVRVTAECVAQADDVEEVTWTKSEGVSRAMYERRENSNTLIIPALVPMDLGTYVCIAIRRNGERAQNSIVFSRIADQGSQFTYEVKGPTEAVEIVTEPPRPAEPEREQNQFSNSEEPKATFVNGRELTANVGGSVVIECEVQGAEKVELVRHGEQLNENHRLENSGRLHRLSLFNLNENDSGYYLCNVEGPNGATRDHLYLHVVRSDESDNQQNYNELDREREEREREERDRAEREQREREEQERIDRENEERERLEREREEQENENQRDRQKPLVYIKTLTNGAPIREGSELKLQCLVNDLDAQIDFGGEINNNEGDNPLLFIEKYDNSIRYELLFSPFLPEHAKQYRCYSRNRYGESEDIAYIEPEADGSFSFRTEKSSSNVLVPGNPHVEISVRGSVEDQSYVELNCRLEHENGFPARSYAWSKFPTLPQTAQRDENRLSITTFDNSKDNGLYTCRVLTDDKEYEKTQLVASNDFLLRKNPFFSFSKSHEEDAIEVRCRPDTASTYTWSAKPELTTPDTYKIDGDVLVLYRSDAVNHFNCDLQVDTEYGPISLDLEVSRTLLESAFASVVDVNVHSSFDENNESVKAECQPDKPVHKIYWERAHGAQFTKNAKLHFGSLVIKNMNDKDEGEYICNVITINYNHLRKSIDLKRPNYGRNHETPILKIKPIEVDLREGGRVELECITEKNLEKYMDDIKWYKMGFLISSTYRLKIENLTEHDKGIYECVLHSKPNSIKFVEFDVEFKNRRPEIIFTFIENDIRPFGQVVVVCENLNHPNSVVRWHKKDNSKNSTSFIKGNRLTIKKLNKYDLNNYECHSESDRINLIKILELDSLEYHKETDYFYDSMRNLNIILSEDASDLRLNGKIVLQCTNEYNFFEKKIWLINKLERNMDNIKIYNDTLIIEPLSKENYGIYSCLFVDIYGEKRLNFKIDENLIRLDNKIEKANPHLHSLDIFDKDKKQFEIDEVINFVHFSGSYSEGFFRLICESNYPDTIKWYKSNGNFSITNANVYNHVVHIEPLEHKDIDIYFCQATSPLGKSIKTSVALTYDFNLIKLEDQSETEPKIIEIYKFGHENIDSEFELKCVTNFQNDMKYWYHNGALIQKDKIGGIKFKKLSFNDEGLYECLVENEFGQDRKAVQIFFPINSWSNYVHNTESKSPLHIETTIETLVNKKDENEETTIFDKNVDRPIGINTKKNGGKSKNSIVIQVLSNPKIDHVENGQVKLRCISDIENATYRWSMVNGTISENTKIENDILELKPFTKRNGGLYRCIASNHILNLHASRRIKISIDTFPKPIKDLSDRIQTIMLSNPTQIKLGDTIQLKCSIDDLNSNVYWTRRGYKLTNRAHETHTENPNSVILTISNFQKEDLGVYVCKARAIDSNLLEYKIKGQAMFYLMASDFGILPNEQKLLGPDIKIKCLQGKNECHKTLKHGDNVEFSCDISNYDTSFPELSIDDIKWRKTNGPVLQNYKIERLTPYQSKLNIPKINDHYVGEYGCYVYASTGTIRQIFEITKILDGYKILVNEPVKNINLTIEKVNGPEKNDKIIGNSFEFDCITDSIWPVEWYKKINSSRKKLITKNSILKFKNLSEIDLGDYVCVSTNNLGIWEIKLEIQPLSYKIDLNPKNDKFEWYKLNGKFRSKVLQIGKRLIIENYQPRYDHGFYSCAISNEKYLASVIYYLGSSDRQSIQNSIKYFQLNIEKIKDLVNSESSTDFDCFNTDSNSSSLNAKLRLSKKKIHILDFDLESIGTYDCQSQSENNKIRTEFILDKFFLEKFGLKLPNITMNLDYENDYYDYGCTVKITCEIHDDGKTDLYSIEWIRDNGQMPKNSHAKENYLIIDNISQDDLGIYTCIVSDQVNQRNTSILFYDQSGSIKHTFDNFVKISNTEAKLDDRLRFLYGRQHLRLGDSFAIECLDLYFDNYLPSWRKLSEEKNSNTFDIAPHILSFNKFSAEDLGTYLCTTKNEKGFLVELGLNINVDHTNKKLIIKNAREVLLPEEYQPIDEIINNELSEIPNIRISFSDKQALSNGERVELFCESDKNSEIEWYKVKENRELGDLITSSSSFIISPIHHNDLGRYRCIAKNEFGYRSRDAILSKQNDSVEFFVFGFIDKISNYSYFNQNSKVSFYKSNAFRKDQLILRVKRTNSSKNIIFRCISSNFFL